MLKRIILGALLLSACALVGSGWPDGGQSCSGAVVCSAFTVNVQSFGAVGDGVADDTAEIQAALDSAHDAGRIVFIPSGTYLITSTLYIGAQTTLKCEQTGGGGVIKASAAFPVGSSEPMLEIGEDIHYGGAPGDRSTDAKVEDCTFDANSRAIIGIRLNGLQQGSGLWHVKVINLGASSLFGVIGRSSDGDSFADMQVDDLYVYWTAAPPATARGVLLSQSSAGLLKFDTVTVNGFAAANADSYGIEMVGITSTVVQNITGEKWGNACLYLNTTTSITAISVRCGGSPTLQTVRIAAATANNNLFAVLAVGAGIITVLDDFATYTGPTNGALPWYFQGGNLNSSPFIRTQTGQPVKWGKSDAPGTCNNTSMEGAMYFDDSLNIMCYCDGTNWRAIDGDAGDPNDADTPSATGCG